MYILLYSFFFYPSEVLTLKIYILTNLHYKKESQTPRKEFVGKLIGKLSYQSNVNLY